MARTLFENVAQVLTCTDATEQSVVEHANVLVADGRIVDIGKHIQAAEQDLRIDCAGGVLTPGFVDSHTHAVFGMWRSGEYAQRCRGVPYMEIARQGGGINSSVRDLRKRSEDELVELSRPRLARMLAHGTTTAEVKSGYGLSTADELKTLRAIRRLSGETPMDLVPTFLGAHEFPLEYRERRDDYVDLLVSESIPAVAAEGLAQFCDVFMEPGVFTAKQSRRVLEAGLAHGLIPKLHADELTNSGAAELGAELGAASADHLGAISEAGIEALANSATVATLLPTTLFFLGKKNYAPARKLIEAGARIALATDFNPGSSPSPSMPLVLTVACSQMGLDPLEAIHAATHGGALALQLTDGRGQLRAGAPADLVLWCVGHYTEIPYRFGWPPIAGVWKDGQQVSGACDPHYHSVSSTP